MKPVKMLIKITGNVYIVLPIILLLTNKTEKDIRYFLYLPKTNKYRKPHPPLKKTQKQNKNKLFRKRKYGNGI